MRYTKELQSNVCEDIKYGLTPQQCADKYNLPVSVIIKWNNLDFTEERAKEVALRKYQVEVTDMEIDLSNKLDQYLDKDISDDDYFDLSDRISKSLYNLVAQVLKKERNLNPSKEDEEQIAINLIEIKQIKKISDIWINNQFIKKYKEY